MRCHLKMNRLVETVLMRGSNIKKNGKDINGLIDNSGKKKKKRKKNKSYRAL